MLSFPKYLFVTLLASIGGVLGNLLAAYIQSSIGSMTETHAIFMGVGVIAVGTVTYSIERNRNFKEKEIEELRKEIAKRRVQLYSLKSSADNGTLLTRLDYQTWYNNQEEIKFIKSKLQKEKESVDNEYIDTTTAPKAPLIAKLIYTVKSLRMLWIVIFAFAFSFPLSAGAHVLIEILWETPIEPEILETPTPTPTFELTRPSPVETEIVPTPETTVDLQVTLEAAPTDEAANEEPTSGAPPEEAVPNFPSTPIVSTGTPTPTLRAGQTPTETATSTTEPVITNAPTSNATVYYPDVATTFDLYETIIVGTTIVGPSDPDPEYALKPPFVFPSGTSVMMYPAVREPIEGKNASYGKCKPCGGEACFGRLRLSRDGKVIANNVELWSYHLEQCITHIYTFEVPGEYVASVFFCNNRFFDCFSNEGWQAFEAVQITVTEP